MPLMAKKKKPADEQEPAPEPNRSPHRTIFVRLDLDLDEMLEEFLNDQDVRPTIKATVQVLLREALTARGYKPRKRNGGAS